MTSGMTTTADIETRAAEWLALKDAADWSPEREVELDAWMTESTANRVAFLRLQAAWIRAERLSALRAPDMEAIERLSSLSGEKSGAHIRRPKWLTLPNWALPLPGAVATLALLAVVGAPVIIDDVGGIRSSSSFATTSTYSTEIGGRELVPLADGSKVELNTETRLRASISKEHRTVWLDRGEAYFEVAHDASRPFIVYAGNRRITVLGTKFDVRCDGHEILLRVTEGKVHLDALHANSGAGQFLQPTVVVRGDEAITKDKATLVALRSPEAIEKELSWRQGLLAFDNWTLADVAREFNRYNRKKLVIADLAAGNIRLGGSFEASNVEAFARLLEQGYGLHLQIGNDQIVISD